jgi:hypothetical protein
MGFMSYLKFYEISFRKASPRTYTEFSDSKYYSSFVRFGRHIHTIQAINPEAFVEFLVKANVPMQNWELEFVYEQFVRELNTRESADSAFERNILIMKQWEMDNNEPWYDFFRKVSTNTATALIRAGRLSPWILYTADSAIEMFNRFTDDQLALIEQYVTPVFWERKFSDHPDDVKFIRELLIEVGI